MADETPKPKLTKARWIAHYEAQLTDGTVLVPGETVVEIPKAEAEESDNWQPVRGSAKKDES